MTYSTFPKRFRRLGITITESLAAIAVAATGLFAIFAFIPFAARQSEVGLDLDASVTEGKNAFQEFDVRGMGNVTNWRLSYVNGSGNNVVPPSAYWGGRPVLIDPLFINNNDYLLSVPAPALPSRPAPPAGEPFDPELSQFPFPLYHEDATLADFTIDRINLAAANNTPYNQAHASQIFQTINDLVYDEPADKLALPQQRYQLNGAIPIKRSNKGRISWTALLVPEANHPHMYRLYVIVFKGRSINYLFNRPSGEAVFNAVPVAAGVPAGGGDFDLTLINSASLPDPTQVNQMTSDDYLNAGDWVLLTDYAIPPAGAVTPGNWRFYKVNRVDPPGNQTRVNARVNLNGPDWTGDSDTTTPGVHEARAIVLSNVINVYEKTIRIEYDSIWNE